MYYWVVICNYIVVIWHCNAVKTALFGVRNKLLGSFPFCSCFDSGWLLMLDGRKKEVMKMEWLHWLPTTSFKRTTNCSIRRGKEKWQRMAAANNRTEEPRARQWEEEKLWKGKEARVTQDQERIPEGTLSGFIHKRIVYGPPLRPLLREPSSPQELWIYWFSFEDCLSDCWTSLRQDKIRSHSDNRKTALLSLYSQMRPPNSLIMWL